MTSKQEQYNMQPDEIEACQLSGYYLHLLSKLFPTYSHPSLPKRGDPRRGLLFKHCYKLVQESRLTKQERKLFVLAQFAVLHKIKLPDGSHPLILPQMLTSEKAWHRWLVWKSAYDRLTKRQGRLETIKKEAETVRCDLLKTKRFLEAKGIHEENLETHLRDGLLFKWVALGRVSPYYLLFSPSVQKWLFQCKINILERYGIDLGLYEKSDIFQKVYEEIFHSCKNS
jgi:hypothetical protein